MKKIFSLALMATALLISGQVKAATILVGESEDITTLDAAFAAAKNNDVIKLTSDVDQIKTIEMYANQKDGNGNAMGRRTLTLDLNGFDVNFSCGDKPASPINFEIYQGSLTVVGEGTIYNNSANQGGYKYNLVEIIVFKLFGAAKDTAGITYLKIDKNVKVIAKYGKCGINVDSYKNAAINGTIQYKNEGAKLNNGEAMAKPAYEAVWGGTYVAANHDNRAYGVVVDVYGYVEGQKYAVQVSGNLGQSKMDGQSANLPKINIKSSAELKSQANESESIGAYVAGASVWNIEGYVHASTGVYVKSGEVTLNGANVKSDSQSYHAPESVSSGADASGSAIVVDSHAGYEGSQKVTITGDTKIEGAKGYAIEEVVTKGTEKAESVVIEGATLVGGEKGAVSCTSYAKNDSIVVINGGSVQGEMVIEKPEGGKDTVAVVDFKGNDTYVTEIKDGDKTITIVTSGNQPAPATDINALQEGDSAQFINKGLQTLNSTKSLGALDFLGKDTLILGNNVTLTVKSINLAQKAQIVIPVGSKLIVTDGGIYASNVGNIVLKADATGMGTMLFSPEVTHNKKPMATVEFVCEGYTLSGTSFKLWDIFSSPFETVTSITSNSGGSYFQYFDGENWTPCTSVQEVYENAVPFKAFAISNVSNEAGKIYTFKGQLQGSTTGKFVVSQGWNYMGNGYTAPMKAQQVIAKLKASGANVKAVMYIWNPIQQRWVFYNEDKMEEVENLGSMRAFALYSSSAANIEVDLDYNTLVWEFNTTQE